MSSRLARVDRRLFQMVAAHHFPGGDRVLPRLSRSANHGLLWFGAAAAMAATGLGGRRTARRAALRGTASLAVASATVNVLAKRAVRRRRPVLTDVPVIRQLNRAPFTTSFPSGHAASAAAFTTGVALVSPKWGAALAPVAASVAFSRVYTGVHYPGDVVAGAAIGVGAAFLVRRLLPSDHLEPPAVRTAVKAPELPEGKGLVVVANAGSGSSGLPPERVIGEVLPRAEVVLCGGEGGVDVTTALEQAAARATELGGALGVSGGDGTVSAAARCAMEHGLPLAVLPGGTLNHFAHDLGIETTEDTRRALADGEAVEVDLARFTNEDAEPTPDDPAIPAAGGTFVNTFSLGVYPEMVRVRERWSPRVGSWPAGVIAAWHVLRAFDPVEMEINGERHRVWLLFAGNCRYEGLGLAPQRRSHLADGLLDVRVAYADRWARTRLLAGALSGRLSSSPVHGAALLRRMRIDWIAPGTRLAYDGEIGDAPGRLLLSKERSALTVYCPQATQRLTPLATTV
ncbi:bifunctional phosphatase PAP2/diacylglycerol kinase family protein [Streptomyces bohaiensis]|uniref:Phosphatase PAP2 family protein n=1 Tax=Streptomyces bohaiensis TaxID=1431344 RepID=A0ABX1CHT0_9ACTN|nr:bifunctional phosphatase PAP2/diacylglycerol kinase family protein [Streptomyces bohaiensis]NJQ17936.1 phosphatase PAP2 family protein [Streptomyces bohaiensis]